MGFLKQMKEMKGMVEDAPAMIRGAQARSAQAQEMAASQQAAAQAQYAAVAAQPTSPAAAAEYAPISGVSLELYSEIARGLADVGYDPARGPEIAAQHGVSAERWQAAVDGWNERIKGQPEVARRFNALYTGRA